MKMETEIGMTDAAMSKGMPRTINSCERQGRTLPQSLCKEHGTSNLLISDLQLPEL